MMGTRERFKGGAEYDYLTRAKRWYACRPGVRQWCKAKFWRRVRHQRRQKDLSMAGEERNR